ncbi:hypothetical protein HHK36_010175 [Tetracentron sinense]|uniref:BHLH domain-containing protein n=1 Tax=Tetracentron sinense TaxID=13715 RepID=A0A835DMC5_TETSI|nr:hypothetical protein HHK36_010175 [Tetracentron sinense]
MESANLHHQHQLQEQLVGSSSLTTQSYYGVGSNHAWNPNIILNGGYFNHNVNGVLSNTRERQKIDILVPPPDLNTSMVQDLGFHWACNAGSFTNDSADELNLGKLKEELSNSFPKYNEMINCPTSYIKDEQQGLHDLSEKFLPKTISSINGFQVSAGDQLYSNAQSSPRFGGVSTSYRGNFSQIFPSTYISNMNPLSSSFSSSLGMNLEALDLLSSCQRPSNSHSKIPPFTNGVTETKRPSNLLEPKASHAAPKKPRFESRSACPLFKVRKEKLGDRIAALQQLVAPYGKTDTASVLMEAIGYIKFLRDQVETLSVPYMKPSSRNKNCSAMHGGSSEDDDSNEEPKRDLRSRGLCLVPLSCTSYVTNDYGGVWPPPNFGRGGT